MQIEVLVEIPKGSRNRYRFDPEHARIRLDRMLPASLQYPSDYGFLPETMTENGEALGALVLVSEPTFPGCLIRVAPIALFKFRDGEDEDRKVLCVPLDDPTWAHIDRLGQVPRHLLKEIERFFTIYQELGDKEFEIEGWEGKEEAERTVETARQRYRGGGEELTSEKPCRIIVVDEDEVTRGRLVTLASDEGYRVTAVGNGQEALDALEVEAVDLVVTELFMSDVDGWQLLDQIKTSHPLTHVVVTTDNITEQGEALLDSREADGYLLKPVQRRPLQILFRALLAPGNLDRAADVVVVSSEQEVLRSIDEALAERGVSVRIFGKVAKAVPNIWNNPPDLALIDARIGHDSGFKLCERIRASLQIPPIPILLLADSSSPDDVRRAVQLRVNGMLLKPFTTENLIERVFKLLRRGL